MKEHMVESSAEIVLDSNDKIRVLHVDDESGILKIAKQCLEMEGPFQVDTAISVEEALMKLEKTKYDIVVSDYMMPEKDGLDFLKELREKGNMIPFIIFTGKGREEIAIKALNLGADQYLNKTGDPETVYFELEHAIRKTVERTKVESALETCGERYGRLFESAVDGILINGSDDRISSLNPATATILGFNSPKELIGKPAVELYADPDSRTRLLQELMEKGSVKERELTWKKKDGTLIEILASVTLKKDEKGNLLRTEGIIRDVSERKRSERLLRENEEKYRELTESISDVFFAFDKDLRCTYWNKASEKLTGTKAIDAIGKSLTEVFPDVKGTKVEQFYQNIVKTNQHHTFVNEYRVGDKDFAFEIDAYPAKDGLSVFVKDITGRKKAEEALKESENYLKAVFSSIFTGVIVVNAETHKIVDANPNALAILGTSREQIIERVCHNFICPADKGKCPISDLKQTVDNSERKLITADGHLKPMIKTVVPIKLKGQEYFVESFVDITERKKTEEALRESEEKYKDLFENALDVILTLDLKGCVTAANNSILRFGYKKEDLVGKNILDFVSKAYSSTVMRDFSQVAQGEPAKNETEIVVPTGKILVEYNARPIAKESNVTGIQINLRDITERKKSECELFDKQTRLRSVFESSSSAILVIDLNGRIVDCNERAEEIFGYSSKSEFVGRSALESIADKDRQRAMENMERTLKQGQLRSIEYAIIAKNGSERQLSVTASVLKDISGNSTGFVSTLEDITERKKSEQLKVESEERFRDLFESIQDPVGIFVGREGRLMDYNTAFKKSSGYTDEELKGKVFLDFVHPDDRAMVLEKYRTEYSEDEFPLIYEIRGVNKKGECIPLELSVSAYKKKGKVIGIEVIHRDLTERKNTEICLKESQRRFEGLFQGNPEAAAYLGPDYRIQDVNPRFEKLFGYSLEEVKSKHINDVVVPDDMRDEGETLDRDARKGYVYRNTVRRKKDGSLVQVSVSAAPIANESGVTGIVAMYKDISDLKNAEKGMDVMNEKLRVVGGLTRHDVRNKLAAVAGSAYLLRKRFASEPNATECLESIEAAVRESERIFDFASAYEKLGVEQLVYVDAKKILEEAIAMFPDSKGIRIVNGCDGLTLLADSLLRQLLYNLIDNSLKYGEKLTQIRIHYEKAEDQLKLVYEDDGVGISKDVKAKLFTEGFTMGKGSGYGLYLIRRMMEVYGWAINETGTHGKGALFTITIPKTNQNGKENYLVT